MPHAASKPCLVRNPYRTRTMKNEEIGPLARVQTSFHDTTQSGSRPALNFTWTNSLIIPCYSLLRRKNSLFRRVGNLQKKRPFFGKIAGSRWPKIGLNRENSLYFPCITGNFTWRRVRARLLPPPLRPRSPAIEERHPPKPAELRPLARSGWSGDDLAGARLAK
jgi:hypothetical protein